MNVKEWEKELDRVLREMDVELGSIRQRVHSWTKEAQDVSGRLSKLLHDSCDLGHVEKGTKSYMEETRELFLNTIRVFENYLKLKRELESLKYVRLDEDEHTTAREWVDLLHKRLEVSGVHEQVARKVVFLGGYVECLEDLLKAWAPPEG